jgi:hypothetical protein
MKSKTIKSLIFFFTILLCAVSCSDSNLKEITKKDAYNIEVQKVETPRGVLILNGKYFLNSDTEIIKGVEKLGVEDNSIWRLNKPKPNLLNIPAPYKLVKKGNNDSITIISYSDTIIAKIR